MIAESGENDDAPVPAPRPAYITEITAPTGEKRPNKFLNVPADAIPKKPTVALEESYADPKRPQIKNVTHNVTRQEFRPPNEDASSSLEEADYLDEQEE